jgi:23S rRNA (cytidine1920-2'-O)/16S rRNA (cytidine1409-2'-O)-methyltransferase
VARRRLDAELVRRGLVPTRSQAQEAVAMGRVRVAGRPAPKASTLVDPADPLELVGPGRRFASRGGDKLDAALARFAVDVVRRRCMDAGASTGGFTDCLLVHGAAHVVAVDVGYGQLAWSLRVDDRVTVLLVVADLSFISLRAVVPALAGVAAGGADLILLVKPQFEAGRADVGRGVVRDPETWARTIEGVASSCEAAGLGTRGVMASPLTGPAGNVEFLLHARKGDPSIPLDLDAAIAQGHAVGRGEGGS